MLGRLVEKSRAEDRPKACGERNIMAAVGGVAPESCGKRRRRVQNDIGPGLIMG